MPHLINQQSPTGWISTLPDLALPKRALELLHRVVLGGCISAITPEVHRSAVEVHGWMTNAELAVPFATILLFSCFRWVHFPESWKGVAY
jgi:hypothetical protein